MHTYHLCVYGLYTLYGRFFFFYCEKLHTGEFATNIIQSLICNWSGPEKGRFDMAMSWSTRQSRTACGLDASMRTRRPWL